MTVNKNECTEGAQDKLELPCSICGCRVDFDYIVSDSFWNEIVPPEHCLNVICLRCLDEMATLQDEDICDHIETVYYCGINKTLQLTPKVMFSYKVETPGVIRKGTNLKLTNSKQTEQI